MIAGGSATLAGTVQAVFASGSYASRAYTILSAAGGLGGTTFNSLTTTSLPAGFAAEPELHRDRCDLEPDRRARGRRAERRNQQNVAGAASTASSTTAARCRPASPASSASPAATSPTR